VQIVEVDVRGQADRDPVHDVPDQRRVLEDDLFLERRRDLVVLFLGLAQQCFHDSRLPVVAFGGSLARRPNRLACRVALEARNVPSAKSAAVTSSGTPLRGGSEPEPGAHTPEITRVFAPACEESLRRRVHRSAAAPDGGRRALQRDCDGEPTRWGII
jgi:hypothetical protein